MSISNDYSPKYLSPGLLVECYVYELSEVDNLLYEMICKGTCNTWTLAVFRILLSGH